MGWFEKSCGRTQYSYHGQILHKSHLKTNVWIIGPQSGRNRRFSQQNGEINYFEIEEKWSRIIAGRSRQFGKAI